MIQTFTIILLLIFSVTVYGQELQFKKTDKNFTLSTATQSQIDSFYYKLQPIETSNFQVHFRISLTGQIIDLFRTNNKSYGGVLTNFITEYGYEKVKGGEYKQSIDKQKVFQKIELDSEKVKYVINCLFTSGQIEIPADSLIANWNTFILDCGTIYFQYQVNGQYTSQEYYCPWSQADTIFLKSTIIENYNLIKDVFSLDSLYKEFETRLPKGKSYTPDGYRIIYIMTENQSEIWVKDKPRRDYLKSVKDTIDSYINSKLSIQKIELNNLRCIGDYRLTFGKNGKLQKIVISKNDKPKLTNSLGLRGFLDDKREIRKCKKIIGEIFSVIDLSFLNLEYEIYRTFSFNYKDEFQLRDSTRY